MLLDTTTGIHLVNPDSNQEHELAFIQFLADEYRCCKKACCRQLQQLVSPHLTDTTAIAIAYALCSMAKAKATTISKSWARKLLQLK